MFCEVFFQSSLVLVPKLKGGVFGSGISYRTSKVFCAFCHANLSSKVKNTPPLSLTPNLTSLFFIIRKGADLKPEVGVKSRGACRNSPALREITRPTFPSALFDLRLLDRFRGTTPRLVSLITFTTTYEESLLSSCLHDIATRSTLEGIPNFFSLSLPDSLLPIKGTECGGIKRSFPNRYIGDDFYN